jgi:hypothetical protein
MAARGFKGILGGIVPDIENAAQYCAYIWLLRALKILAIPKVHPQSVHSSIIRGIAKISALLTVV